MHGVKEEAGGRAGSKGHRVAFRGWKWFRLIVVKGVLIFKYKWVNCISTKMF